jgi:FkbM family methyltransferase
MLIVERYGKKLQFDDDGFVEPPYVYGPLLDGRVYEEKFLDHIRDQQRRGVYVDIGAHLGTHTVWFAALCPSTHVHAFEPIDRNVAMVRRNVAANGLEGKVTVHHVGLSDSAGQATNTLGPEHQMGFMADAVAAVETFDVVRLDQVLRRVPVAVIKLDVEGMETAALRGADRILSRWRPVVYAEAFNSKALAEIKETLRPYGYQATGKVFNATPTFEFTAPPRPRFESLRPVWRRLPPRLRRAVKSAFRSR